MFKVTLESETWPPVLHSETPYPRVALQDASELFDVCWGLNIVGVVVVREDGEAVAVFKTGKGK